MIFYKESRHLAVEAIQIHSLNVVNFHIETGRRGWQVVGCYISLNKASTLERVVEAIGQQLGRRSSLPGNLMHIWRPQMDKNVTIPLQG